jgi:hypothetical protein
MPLDETASRNDFPPTRTYFMLVRTNHMTPRLKCCSPLLSTSARLTWHDATGCAAAVPDGALSLCVGVSASQGVNQPVLGRCEFSNLLATAHDHPEDPRHTANFSSSQLQGSGRPQDTHGLASHAVEIRDEGFV